MSETNEITEAAVANPMDTALASVVDALVEMMRSGVRPELLEAQRVLLHRLATQGDMFPSRIPAPLNITEVGGYLNLLERSGHSDLRLSAMTGALGIAGPSLDLNAAAGEATVGFVMTRNDRPAGPAQAAIPPLVPIRADFHSPTLAALEHIRALGCKLPLRAFKAILPASQPDQTMPDTAVALDALGRRLQAFPGTFLIDPDSDPLVIARPEAPAGEPLQLMARELGDGGLLPTASWVPLSASEVAIIEEPARDAAYLEIAPIMAAAGWVQASPMVPPENIRNPGSLPEFRNLTNLIPGETTLLEELSLLYSQAAIARSAFAPFGGWIWSGQAFVAPT